METTQKQILNITEVNPQCESFFKMATSWKFKLFMMANLPMGFIAGLTVEELNGEVCKVSVPFKWLNKNPFQSMYFAVLGMAAELSTALPCTASFYKNEPKVNMLVSKVESQFTKKSKDRITFVCKDVDKVFAAVQETKQTGQWTNARLETIGYNPNQEEVARFWVEWSFRAKI